MQIIVKAVKHLRNIKLKKKKWNPVAVALIHLQSHV